MKSAKEMEDFDGRFDDETRALLKRRRLSLGLSYARLAQALNVSWLTLRNWEQGHVSKCHASQVMPLRNFLGGKSDGRLMSMEEGCPGCMEWASGGGYQDILDKIRGVSRLCAGMSDVSSRMHLRIRQASKAALERYSRKLQV